MTLFDLFFEKDFRYAFPDSRPYIIFKNKLIWHGYIYDILFDENYDRLINFYKIEKIIHLGNALKIYLKDGD